MYFNINGFLLNRINLSPWFVYMYNKNSKSCHTVFLLFKYKRVYGGVVCIVYNKVPRK